MRKPDFTKAPDPRGAISYSLTVSYRECRPFAYGIGRHDCCAACWRGEKRGSGVRLVVLGKQDSASGYAHLGGNDSTHPHFLPQRILHRLGECTPGSWEGTQGRGEYPIELEHRTFV